MEKLRDVWSTESYGVDGAKWRLLEVLCTVLFLGGVLFECVIPYVVLISKSSAIRHIHPPSPPSCVLLKEVESIWLSLFIIGIA